MIQKEVMRKNENISLENGEEWGLGAKVASESSSNSIGNILIWFKEDLWTKKLKNNQ